MFYSVRKSMCINLIFLEFFNTSLIFWHHFPWFLDVPTYIICSLWMKNKLILVSHLLLFINQILNLIFYIFWLINLCLYRFWIITFIHFSIFRWVKGVADHCFRNWKVCIHYRLSMPHLFFKCFLIWKHCFTLLSIWCLTIQILLLKCLWCLNWIVSINYFFLNIFMYTI